DLTTTSTTAALFNAAATTLNIGGVATAITVGATTGITNVRNELQVGSGTTDATQSLLQVDSFDTYADTATCSTTVNQGAIYYNTKSNAVRGCVNGVWEDMVSTASLGLQLFGVVPDSGPTPGNWVGINATIANNGPCKVYVGSVNSGSSASIRWTSCTAFSGGRKVIVPAQTSDVAITTTNGNFVHVCLTGTDGQPAISTSGTENANLPAFSAAAPILCLADVRTSATAINAIYDTRTFTTTTKEIVNNTSATPGVGMLVIQSGTAGQVNTSSTTAGSAKLRGVIVAATSGAQTANTMNAIIATAGPNYAKATAATVGAYVQNGATAGYANTAANAPAPLNGAYASLGLALSGFSTTCGVLADTCRTSIAVNLNPR
ncbi:MAG TPA: hypothetical protein VF272_03560, partial [Candidatus Saccharimonadia bacterium]